MRGPHHNHGDEPAEIVITSSYNDRYMVVPRSWAQDQHLTYAARGLLLHLAAHADGTDLTAAELATHSTDSEASVGALLIELRDAGYVNGGHAGGGL